MRHFTMPCLVTLLVAGTTTGVAQTESEKKPRRSGPRSASYLRSLPMGSFVDSVSLNNLAELVVTDTKIAQPQEMVTQKVEILYEEEFAQQTNAHRNLAELLQYSSGQFVNILSRNDANWGSYAGLGPKYNGYLLDGLPMDSFTDGMSLDPWAFERVELHKGPASILYSNYLTMDYAGNQMPLAGTTNWILRDRIEERSTRVQLGGGSFQTYDARIYHQDRQGGVSYFVGANQELSDYTNYGTKDSWLQIQGKPDYQKTKLYGKVSAQLGREDQILSLFMNHTTHMGDAGRPNRDFSHTYDTANLVYSNQMSENVHLQFKTGYRGYERRWGEDQYPASLDLREHDGVQQRIMPSDLTFSFKHGSGSLLTAGMDHQSADFRTYADTSGPRAYGNDVQARSLGFFLQEKWVTGDWVLRAGTRFNQSRQDYRLLSGNPPDQAGRSWRKSLWSAGVRFNANPDLAFFANAGSSFVVPSALQIGGTLTASDTGVPGLNGRLPNFDLKPEKGIGSDTGLEWHPVSGVSLVVRGFLNQIDDAIVDNVISAAPSQSRSVNAGRTRSLGIEFSLEQLLGEHIQWFSNLTWTRTRVTNPLDPDQDRSEIPFGPNYVANVGITLDLPPGWTVSLYAHAVGTYYDSTTKASRLTYGPYQVLSLCLNKTVVRREGYTLTFALDLNNLANRKYVMPWQFQDPGFSAMASLQLRF